MYVYSKRAKLRETENRTVVARAWEVGKMRRRWSESINFQL